MANHQRFGETKPTDEIKSPRLSGRFMIRPDMAEEIIFYQFSRPMVEAGDFRHFLTIYGPDKLPGGARLGDMMNTLAFGIEGYDDDPREVHAVPEIRRFYAAFHQAWPYWLYFCNLDTEALRMMVLCCLPSVNTMQVDGRANVAVEYSPLELVRFVGNDFGPMNLMCDRAEMSERGIYDRTKAVFEYFKLPFDAEPPPASASYVTSHLTPRTAQVGRNEPCPCGSGKKYKKCCSK